MTNEVAIILCGVFWAASCLISNYLWWWEFGEVPPLMVIVVTVVLAPATLAASLVNLPGATRHA